MTSPATMRNWLVLATTKHKLAYHNYKLLAEWLDCYQYVLPNERVLRVTPKIKITCSLDALQVWQLCDLYNSTLKPYEQVLLASTYGKDYLCVI
jgi:hypothetical protein